MIAWRLCKRKYAARDSLLGGAGAKDFGGRWNRVGLPVVYSSASSSLALLETLVNAGVATLPTSIVVAQIIIPDGVTTEQILSEQLPSDWREVGNEHCVNIGSEWIRSERTLVLIVPSAVNPSESNILLNPAHPDISRCTIGDVMDVTYDQRLLNLFTRR